MNFLPWRNRVKAPSLTDQLAEAMSRRVKRVLLLEDDRNWRDLVAAVAHDYELEIVEASTSGQARQLIMDGYPVDAAIVDVGVANGDGIEFYRWLKFSHPQVYVVFLTCSPVEKVSGRIHEVGSAPVYSKPAVMTVNFLTDFIERMGAKRRCPA